MERKKRSFIVLKHFFISFDSAVQSPVRRLWKCCSFILNCNNLEKPLERFRRRLHALFKLCAISWLYMFDLMLPMSIVRTERNFVFDDDYGDFENDSILRSFRKEDQQKIRSNSIDRIREMIVHTRIFS